MAFHHNFDSSDNRRHWLDRIDDYLAGRLSPEEQEAFEARYFEDTELFHEVQMRAELRQALGEAATGHLSTEPSGKRHPVRPAPASGPTRSWLPPLFSAAVVAAVLFVSSLFLTRPGAPTGANLAEGFVPDPQMELAVNDTYRSNLFVTDVRPAIDPATPNTIPIYASPLSFRWRVWQLDQEVSIPLDLTILSNRGDIVETVTALNRFELSRPLDAGIYYWMLEYRDSPVHVSKFIVLPRVAP